MGTFCILARAPSFPAFMSFNKDSLSAEQNPRIRTLKKKTSYCRILVSTIGGFIMSGKKGMKHYSSLIIDDVIKLKSEGKTNKEIVEIFGLKNIKAVKNIVQLYNKKQCALSAGISPKRRGRLAKGYQITEDEKDNEIKRLKMENELLRSFLQLGGRR